MRRLLPLFACAIFLSAAIIAGPAAAATVDFGPLAGELLGILVATVGAALAAAIVGLIVRLAGRLGIEIEETRRRRLQEMVENGIRAAAARRGVALGGSLEVEVRDGIVAEAAGHLARHGATTIRKLREDPEDVAMLRDIVTAHGGRLLGIGRQQGEAA